MKYLKSTILAMKWFSLAALLGCSPKNIIRGSLPSGPFEICWEVTESRSGTWFNNGGDLTTTTLQWANKALVKQIGQHFDEEMRKGKFQEFFARYE